MNDDRRPRLITAALTLGLPLMAGTCLAAWALAISPLQSTTQAVALIGAVEAADRRDREQTSVTFLEASPYPVVSQSSGTVTGVSITPGERVVAGRSALAVDGKPVVAYVSHAPLYRDIVEGLEGTDVKTAQRVLVNLGYLDAVSGHAEDATMSAIRAFNAAHGYGRAGRSLAVGSLLWIPKGSAAPQSVKVRIGQVIAPQTELYDTTSSGDRVQVSAKSSPADRILTVGSATATLPAGHTAITESADIATIKAAMGTEKQAAATLESMTPRAVGTVPASAIVVGTDGAKCFFSDTHGPAIRIDAVDGSFGLVDVDATLVGTPVLINPRSTRENLSCNS